MGTLYITNPYQKEARSIYDSLPISMSIPEKRKILKDKYSKYVDPKSINRWVRKWQSEND